MGPIFKFLSSLRSLAKSKNITIDEAYKAAQQEFGEVSDLLKLQINKIFKDVEAPSIRKPSKPEGKLIEASFKPGKDKYGKVVEKSPSQEEGIEFSIPSQGIIRQKGTVDELMNYLSTNPYRPKGPLDPNTGMTRTAARTILRKLLDEDKITIPDERERKAIAEGYQGGVDPIEVFEKVFGRENLQDLSELADEMNRAGDYTELEKILKREKLFDLEQKSKYEKDPGGMTDEELREVLKDKLGKDPDDTGFATGGRVGFAAGGIKGLIKMINKKFGKGTVKLAKDVKRPESAEMREAFEKFKKRQNFAFGSGMKLAGFLAIRGKTLMDEIRKAVQNLNVSGDRKLDADIAVDDMLEELGASRDQFDQKDILDAYDKAYNMLTEEIQMTRELAPKMTERMELKAKYPGIDEDTLTEIIEMDPERKAAMMADMEMGEKLIEEGKGVDEVKDILTKKETRTKQAKGGLAYLMGL